MKNLYVSLVKKKNKIELENSHDIARQLELSKDLDKQDKSNFEMETYSDHV